MLYENRGFYVSALQHIPDRQFKMIRHYGTILEEPEDICSIYGEV